MQSIKTGIINVQTKKRTEIVDITTTVNALLKDECQLCHIHVMHTTAAIGIVDVDPGSELDYIKAFEQIAPKLDYQHSYNPESMPQHVLSTLLGTTITLPAANSKLTLGEWQRLVLIELNGPRTRKVAITGSK